MTALLATGPEGMISVWSSIWSATMPAPMLHGNASSGHSLVPASWINNNTHMGAKHDAKTSSQSLHHKAQFGASLTQDGEGMPLHVYPKRRPRAYTRCIPIPLPPNNLYAPHVHTHTHTHTVFSKTHSKYILYECILCCYWILIVQQLAHQIRV